MFDRFRKLIGRKPSPVAAGFVFDLKNKTLGLDLYGSPFEICAAAKEATGNPLRETFDHIDTRLVATEAGFDQPALEWNGGPNAERVIDLMELVSQNDVRAVAGFRDVLAPGVSGNHVAIVSAAHNGLLDMVQALINAGADVRAESTLGMSALHWACGRGHTAVASALVLAGADVTAQNWFFLTAPELAALNGHTRLAHKLQPASADWANVNLCELVCERMNSR